MKINAARLLNDLKALREITATPGQGVTRFSYSEEDRRAREYLARIAQKYGFIMETDPVGNIKIFPPEGKGRTIIGSHIDTVRSGGWLDGIYGVMSGMEVLRTLADNGVSRDVALMIYAEEEGSVFGSTMTGSKFLTGRYTAEDLDKLVRSNTIEEIVGKHITKLYKGAVDTLVDPIVRKVAMPIKAVLGKSKITVSDFVNIQIGDIIKLGSKVDSELDVYVGNIKKFKALPGTSRDGYAVRVTEVLREEE